MTDEDRDILLLQTAECVRQASCLLLWFHDRRNRGMDELSQKLNTMAKTIDEIKKGSAK